MLTMIICLSAIFVSFLCYVLFDFFKFSNLKSEKKKLQEDLIHKNAVEGYLNQRIVDLEGKIKILENTNDKNHKVFDELTLKQNEISQIKLENSILSKDLEVYKNERNQLQTQFATLQERFKSQEDTIKTLQSMENALIDKTIKAINQISDDILKKNNETTDNFRKITEEKTKEFTTTSLDATKNITNELLKKLDEAGKQIYNLSSKNEINEKNLKKIIDIFKGSQTTGVQAEIILENTLTNSQLIKGNDFEIQYSTNNDNGKYRPDAVVFLTNNDIMIVDSKSSQFFLNDEELTEEERMLKIKTSMQNHIKTLSSKNYKESVISDLEKNKKRSVANVYLFMFIPSEIFIDTINKAFSNFHSECSKNNIYPCGPTTLKYALDIVKISKTQYHADKNFKQIIKDVQELIKRSENLSDKAFNIIKEYNDMGVKIKEFQGSLEGRFIPQRNKITKSIENNNIDFDFIENSKEDNKENYKEIAKDNNEFEMDKLI